MTKEISFYSGPFELKGQVDYPSDVSQKFPLIFIIPGQAQHTRDGNAKGYPGFKGYYDSITSTLIRYGVAVFRYDKGGTGKSSSGLSAASDTLAAYRAATKLNNIDSQNISILAHGGGAAFIFRSWIEFQKPYPPQSIILLASGVNDKKLQNINVPICVILGSNYGLRSKNALDRYHKLTKQVIKLVEIEESNEQLCDMRNENVSVLKPKGCSLHYLVHETLVEWISQIINQE